MPKNYTTPEMSYDQRLADWLSGKCPYCHSKKIKETEAKRGGKHFICTEELCGAENYFTKGGIG